MNVLCIIGYILGKATFYGLVKPAFLERRFLLKTKKIRTLLSFNVVSKMFLLYADGTEKRQFSIFYIT